ncbi:MAG TPA: hypothetical protein VGG27_10905 [Magnetospirillaceae bacterium]|jgi:hypothetical protein
MTPSANPLHNALRPVIALQLANLAICVTLLATAGVLSDVPPPVWVRGTIMLIVAILMVLFGVKMRRGRRWAYIRARWIAVAGTIGFFAIAILPGPFPVWMRIEQGVQALLFLALAWLLTRPRVRAFFPKASRNTNPTADQAIAG